MAMPVFTAGRKVRASELKAMADQLDSLTFGAWTPYTPTVTASGGGYSAGGATLTGSRYRRAAGSSFCLVEIRFTCGSTTNFGSGYLRFTLPFNATSDAIASTMGDMWIQDVSTQARPGSCHIESAGIVVPVGSGGVVTGTSPMTWANTDYMVMSIGYEVA